MIKTKREPIHKKLNCLGYYGFGGGYAMALGATLEDRGLYCQACPLKIGCWEKHRARVRELYPVLVEAFDELVEECGGRGDLAVVKFKELYGALEPQVAVMAGNIEDGICAQKTGSVKDRGETTLPYPFTIPASS